jgi:hypothetical protein
VNFFCISKVVEGSRRGGFGCFSSWELRLFSVDELGPPGFALLNYVVVALVVGFRGFS